jgi:hypothetical protein
VSHPIFAEKITAFARLQDRLKESAEGMEPDAQSPVPRDCCNIIPPQILPREQLAVLGLKQKAILAFANVGLERIGERFTKVAVAITIIGLGRFERGSLSPLLVDRDDLSVRRNMLPDFWSKQFADSHTCAAERCSDHRITVRR